MNPVVVAIADGIARLTLNRAAKRNALDQATIAALHREVGRCAADESVRLLEITGAGEAFCAGADLAEMRAQAGATEAHNLVHAQHLARLLGCIDSCPKPTIARVNGDGYGGALGLMAACDVVVAAEHARFSFSEVRLGIVPAVISPFVLAKMSRSAARRYFLTAELIPAATLRDAGLIHEVVPSAQLDSTCAGLCEALLRGAPLAQAEAKRLIGEVASDPRSRAEVALAMAARLAHLRVQPEAREGFDAFFNKRIPVWRATADE